MSRSLFCLLFECLFTGVVSAQTTNSAPYCTPGYKYPAATTDMITNVTIGAFTNNSGLYNNSNYVYYNNLDPIVLGKGTMNSISMTGVRSTTTTTVVVWLDLNRNDSFEFSAEVMCLIPCDTLPNWSKSCNIYVNPNADTGITRMRVMSYGTDTGFWITVCPTGGQTTMSPERGEAEDYLVRIVETTGIAQSSIAGTMVYPNPANDVLTIVTDRSKYKGVPIGTMHDICGREVLSTPLSADGKIDVSLLPNGNYTLSISDGVLIVERCRVLVSR